MPDTINIDARPKTNYFLLALLGVAIIFIGILMFRGCGKSAELANVQKAYADSLKTVQTALNSSRYTDSIHSRETEDRAALATKQGKQHEDSLQRQIAIRDNRNKGLSDWIATHQPKAVDTLGWVLVPRDYPDSCIAAGIALQQAAKDNDSAKKTARATEDLLYAEIMLREQSIATKDHDFEKCNDNFRKLYVSDSVAIRKLSPRGALLGGVSGQYSPSYGQAGGWLMYKNKNGRCYGAGFGYNSFNKTYFEGRVGITIFK